MLMQPSIMCGKSRHYLFKNGIKLENTDAKSNSTSARRGTCHTNVQIYWLDRSNDSTLNMF